MSNAHVLDNPIWNALTNQHAAIAQGTHLARRYPTDIAPFGAVAANTEEAFESLAALIPVGEAAVLLDSQPSDATTWKLLREFRLNQMVYEGPMIEPVSDDCVLTPLSQADVPLMLKLVDQTHPGPFMPRTIELGGYLGIWQEGQLAAMAGKRFHVPGYHEISAVCTHPDFQKRGYARLLIRQLIHQIQAAGEIPFLHVIPENTAAISVYESLGFKRRAEFSLFVVKRQ